MAWTTRTVEGETIVRDYVEYSDGEGRVIRIVSTHSASCQAGAPHTHVEQLVPILEGGTVAEITAQLDALLLGG